MNISSSGEKVTRAVDEQCVCDITPTLTWVLSHRDAHNSNYIFMQQCIKKYGQSQSCLKARGLRAYASICNSRSNSNIRWCIFKWICRQPFASQGGCGPHPWDTQEGWHHPDSPKVEESHVIFLFFSWPGRNTSSAVAWHVSYFPAEPSTCHYLCPGGAVAHCPLSSCHLGGVTGVLWDACPAPELVL